MKPEKKTLSTSDAGLLLGVNPNKILRVVWENRLLQRPAKVGRGFYRWGFADVKRLSKVLFGEKSKAFSKTKFDSFKR